VAQVAIDLREHETADAIVQNNIMNSLEAIKERQKSE
jgi:hypothetical protein